MIPPVPSVSFPIYGLSSKFTGRRLRGQWDRMQQSYDPDCRVPPVYSVMLIHAAGEDVSQPEIVIDVTTIAKRPGRLPHPAPFQEAVSAALVGLVGIASFGFPAEERVLSTQLLYERIEPLRDGLGSWQRIALEADSRVIQAFLYETDGMWAVVVDLDEHVTLGLSGRGAAPDEYDLVRIEDVRLYESP